jgi:hypothetical protein
MAANDKGRKHAATKAIVQDGLVMNLDAGVNDSYSGTGSTWTDLTGNNHFTAYNSPSFTTNNGGMFVFDGTDDYLENTNPVGITVTGAKTFCTYAKIDITSGWNSDFIFKITAGSQYALSFTARSYNNNPTLSIGYYSGAGGGFPAGYTYNHDGSIFGQYHFYTITQYSSYVELYIDDQLIVNYDTGLGGVNSYLTMGNLQICGTTGIISNDTLEGEMASSLLYNRRLSAKEVKQNYNVMRHRFGI